MQYPIYRKYPNNKSYFRITSEKRFEELKVTGKLVERYTFEAEILPDRLFIADMVDMAGGHWVESSEGEFSAMEKNLAG